jgi:hypothetical protein
LQKAKLSSSIVIFCSLLSLFSTFITLYSVPYLHCFVPWCVIRNYLLNWGWINVIYNQRSEEKSSVHGNNVKPRRLRINERLFRSSTRFPSPSFHLFLLHQDDPGTRRPSVYSNSRHKFPSRTDPAAKFPNASTGTWFPAGCPIHSAPIQRSVDVCAAKGW